MQNFGVTNKEHYGMLWYFLQWSIHVLYTLCGYYAHFSEKKKEKWFNYVVTFFFNATNLGRSDNTKRRKKRGWPK